MIKCRNANDFFYGSVENCIGQWQCDFLVKQMSKPLVEINFSRQLIIHNSIHSIDSSQFAFGSWIIMSIMNDGAESHRAQKAYERNMNDMIFVPYPAR